MLIQMIPRIPEASNKCKWIGPQVRVEVVAVANLRTVIILILLKLMHLTQANQIKAHVLEQAKKRLDIIHQDKGQPDIAV